MWSPPPLVTARFCAVTAFVVRAGAPSGAAAVYTAHAPAARLNASVAGVPTGVVLSVSVAAVSCAGQGDWSPNTSAMALSRPDAPRRAGSLPRALTRARRSRGTRPRSQGSRSCRTRWRGRRRAASRGRDGGCDGRVPRAVHAHGTGPRRALHLGRARRVREGCSVLPQSLVGAIWRRAHVCGPAARGPARESEGHPHRRVRRLGALRRHAARESQVRRGRDTTALFWVAATAFHACSTRASSSCPRAARASRWASSFRCSRRPGAARARGGVLRALPALSRAAAAALALV